MMHTICGTPAFMGPELVQQVPYGPKVDIWALGVTLFWMLCGELPWDPCTVNQPAVIASILKGEVDFSSGLISNVSAEAKDLIKSMLTPSPSQRPNTSQCMEHPWIKYSGESFSVSVVRNHKAFLMLKSSSMFTGVDESVIAELSNDLQRRTVNPGEPVFDWHLVDVGFCLIENGQVKISLGDSRDVLVKEGTVLLAVDSILNNVPGAVSSASSPSRRSSRRFSWEQGWSEGAPARVQVPADGALPFPATVYTLPVTAVAKTLAQNPTARASLATFAAQVLQYQEKMVSLTAAGPDVTASICNMDELVDAEGSLGASTISLPPAVTSGDSSQGVEGGSAGLRVEDSEDRNTDLACIQEEAEDSTGSDTIKAKNLKVKRTCDPTALPQFKRVRLVFIVITAATRMRRLVCPHGLLPPPYLQQSPVTSPHAPPAAARPAPEPDGGAAFDDDTGREQPSGRNVEPGCASVGTGEVIGSDAWTTFGPLPQTTQLTIASAPRYMPPLPSVPLDASQTGSVDSSAAGRLESSGSVGGGGAAGLLEALRRCEGVMALADPDNEGSVVLMRTHGVRWQDCGLRGRLLWAPPRAKGQKKRVAGGPAWRRRRNSSMLRSYRDAEDDDDDGDEDGDVRGGRRRAVSLEGGSGRDSALLPQVNSSN